ncbi:MAG: hypothetical protein K2W99_03605 [Chthoniobacterales bacterium]|nr:hypothetical protein [Chthoniobacterales bacterium]
MKSVTRVLSKLASVDGHACREAAVTDCQRQPEGRTVEKTVSQLPGVSGAQQPSVYEILAGASPGATPQFATEVEFRKKPTEEIKKYRYHALEASTTGDQALAKQWRMAADQAYNFYIQQQWKQESPPLPQINPTTQNSRPLRTLSFNYQVQATRQEVCSILQASQALEQKDRKLAQRLAATALTIREAATCYHYWIAQAKQEAYQSNSDKIASSLEKAELYRLNAFEASQTHHLKLAQDWAMAACLSQEAARKLKMAHATYHDKLRHLLTDYWRVAAHAAHHAADFRSRVAELIALQQKELASEWKRAALLADRAMVLKAKAARAHKEKDEFLSIDWSLAGYWMALAADIKVFLIKTSSQKIELPFWERAFTAVENTANVYQQSLYSLEDNKEKQSYWLDLIPSLEDAADRAILLAEKELE